MKKIIPMLIIFFVSCGGQTLEREKAKTTAENLINVIKEKKFGNLSNNYTNSFFQNTTEKQWIFTLNKINDFLGPIESYQLIESNIELNAGDQDYIVLLYEIQHSKFKSQQKFTIMIEDGKYKVAGHNIKSDAL